MAGKEQRVRAFNTVIKKYKWDLEQIQSDMMRANTIFVDAERALEKAFHEVANIEEDIRNSLCNTEGFSPDLIQSMREFLMRKNKNLQDREKDKLIAQNAVDDIRQQLERNHLKLKGIEKLLDRRLASIRLDDEKQEMKMYDELWLQRMDGKHK